jgi:N-terminal acetyltransferase B complex catalytic subunit
MEDLLQFNHINFDVLTETYHTSFYCSYLAQWPTLFIVATSPYSVHACSSATTQGADNGMNASGSLMGYLIGKVEGDTSPTLPVPQYHGHVSAVTVSPHYRRMGIAQTLMSYFENLCDKTYHTYFVDLFVRPSNTLAIKMYSSKFGYIKYRTVLNYYSGEYPEDAYDMRKSLPRYVLSCVISFAYWIRTIAVVSHLSPTMKPSGIFTSKRLFRVRSQFGQKTWNGNCHSERDCLRWIWIRMDSDNL